jgi:FkbM family methyltransferase
MLIPFQEILATLPKRPTNILHVGAHLAEELPIYNAAGIQSYWVEPNPDLFKEVEKKVGSDNCIRLAVSDKINEVVDFHRVYSLDGTNKGCSSLLKPTRMLENPYLRQIDTIKVRTTTLDMLNQFMGPFDLLNMDIEGNELKALHGGNDFLNSEELLGIILEFRTLSAYDGDCTLSELDEYLEKYKFKRVYTKYATDEKIWGDCLYVKSQNNGGNV